MIVQKINKTFNDDMEVAIVYYSILSSLGEWGITDKQLKLLAFTAIRGTITPKPAREEFAEKYKSSLATIENMKGVLSDMKLLVKDEDGMYRVNKQICPGFDGHIALNLLFINKKE